MEDDKILSYKDVALRRSDLGILRGQDFLNDRIIEFYFSYLDSGCSSQDILLCLFMEDDKILSYKDAEKLPEKKVVIFSINNNTDVAQAQGAVVGFMGDSESGSSEISLSECPTMPQQMNGYDCGLYVTAIAKLVCDWHKNGGSTNNEELWFSALKEVKPQMVSNMRSDIIMLIQDLMAKK
ncbi:hypothetical protein MKW92_006162 [Papaver armeniacum]|nr:hypothetical protein MKW92_006162 [Papaver armeniacum]